VDARAALEERLRLIVRTVCARPGLEVTTEASPTVRARLAAEGKDVDEEWFTWQEHGPGGHDAGERGRIARTWVHLPPRLLEMPEEVAKGKAAHEAGHVAITRHGGFVPDEVLAQPGFHLLLSSTEERAVDEVVRRRFAGAGIWLDAARRDSVREAVEAGPGISEAPLFVQVANLVVYAPHLGSGPAGGTDAAADFLASLDPEAARVYARIAPDVELLERTLPPEGAGEDEVKASAIERYRIVWERIWPVLRPLVTRDAARRTPESLGSLAAALTRTRAGALDPRRPESPAERSTRVERERSAAEMREIGARTAALAASRNPYDAARESVRSLEEGLVSRLEEILRPTSRSRTRLASSGSRIHLPSVFRWTARRAAGVPESNPRLFGKRSLPGRRDTAITLLVDLSGSMRFGGKVEETFRAAVLLAESLARLDVPFEVLGFQDEPIVLKAFDEALGAAVRLRMAGMRGEVEGSNPGGRNHPEWNDDGPCLLAASARLAARAGGDAFLLVLSDGLPEGLRSDAADLRAAVARIRAETAQNLVGLGLGDGTEHVRDFYPTSIAGIRADDLPRVLGDLLEAILADPASFRDPAHSGPP
jgi:hypothetical protein